jgi:hypothetical protein
MFIFIVSPQFYMTQLDNYPAHVSCAASYSRIHCEARDGCTQHLYRKSEIEWAHENSHPLDAARGRLQVLLQRRLSMTTPIPAQLSNYSRTTHCYLLRRISSPLISLNLPIITTEVHPNYLRSLEPMIKKGGC